MGIAGRGQEAGVLSGAQALAAVLEWGAENRYARTTQGLGLVPALVCLLDSAGIRTEGQSGCTSAACHPLGPFTTLNCTA